MTRVRFYLCSCGAPHHDLPCCVACGRRRERIPVPRLVGVVEEEVAPWLNGAAAERLSQGVLDLGGAA